MLRGGAPRTFIGMCGGVRIPCLHNPLRLGTWSGDLFCAGMIWDSHYGARYSCWYTLVGGSTLGLFRKQFCYCAVPLGVALPRTTWLFALYDTKVRPVRHCNFGRPSVYLFELYYVFCVMYSVFCMLCFVLRVLNSVF